MYLRKGDMRIIELRGYKKKLDFFFRFPKGRSLFLLS